jgi:hypothetical protein
VNILRILATVVALLVAAAYVMANYDERPADRSATEVRGL